MILFLLSFSLSFGKFPSFLGKVFLFPLSFLRKVVSFLPSEVEWSNLLKHTWSETPGNSLSTSMTGKLQSSTLSIRTSRNDTNVSGVLDGSNNTCSQNELLPGFSEMEQVDAVFATFPDVRMHVDVGVFSSKMGLSGQEHMDVLVGGGESSRYFRHSLF
jgi:hypothetical protein